tara:strand:+ start:7070 stop:7282 length:213 start_codon:yes stop_codon:yes gene_type:complete
MWIYLNSNYQTLYNKYAIIKYVKGYGKKYNYGIIEKIHLNSKQLQIIKNDNSRTLISFELIKKVMIPSFV